MKNISKLVSKCVILSMILSSGVVMAADGDYDNMTLTERLYQHDSFGAQWGFDVGSDGLWLVPKAPVEGTYSAPFKLRNAAAANTLVVGGNDEGTEGYVGIGIDTPTAKLDVNGTIAGKFTGSDSANNHNLLGLSVDNSGDGASDVGFSMENIETDFKWTFRTYNPSEGFAASKIGTGGTEFEVGNTGTDLSTTVVKMGGVVVFKDGHLVNTSGNELASLVQEQNIKLATMEVEAKAMKAEITELKIMKQKVAMMESILTNLALNTSNAKKEKVSMK